MGDAGLTPWWITIAVGIAGTLCAAIGKLWTENRGMRAELAAANVRIVELQIEAAKRSDEHQAEHRRDLRRLVGLSTSIEPGAASPFDVYPPVVVRDKPARPRRSGKKPETG